MLLVDGILILSEAYKKIGQFGLTISTNMNDGLEGGPSQNKLYTKLIKSCILYERVLQHIVLNNAGDKILAIKGTTVVELNQLLFCLKEVAEINQLPGAPVPLRVFRTDLIGQGPQGNPGVNGQNAFVYIRYAADDQGVGFSAIPGPSKPYISIRTSINPLPDNIGTHAGNWQLYFGQAGTNGTNGTNGLNSSVFQAWASDNIGTDFTLTYNPILKYTSFLSKNNNIPPIVSDFTYWTKYNGDNGNDGINGANGNTVLSLIVDPQASDGNDGDFAINISAWTIFGPKVSGAWPSGAPLIGIQGPAGPSGLNGTDGLNGSNGIDSFMYVAHADSITGTGYILTASNDPTASVSAFDSTKKYVAFISSSTALGPTISFANFTGKWTKYAGDGDRWSTTSTTSMTIGLGIQTLNVELGLAYVTGQRIVIAVDSQPDKRMEGYLINYNPLTGQFSADIDSLGSGTGTYSTWDVSLQASLPNSSIVAFQNLDVDSGATRVIDTVPMASAKRIEWEYLIEKGSNSRGGIMSVIRNGSTVQGSDNLIAPDIGTVDPILDADTSGSDIRLIATTATNDWIIKGLRRIIA
jgi:hypothetical protein